MVKSMLSIIFVASVFYFPFIVDTARGTAGGQDNDDAADGQSAAVAPNERFQDMFILTEKNVTEKLMKRKDAWIVVFHGGVVDLHWKTMASTLRGVVWVGLVDKTDFRLMTHLGVNKLKPPKARVYPYGGSIVKKKYAEDVESPSEAKLKAVKSLVDRTVKLKGKSGLVDMVRDCFTSSPSKFPVLLLTNELHTPAIFKSLALRLERYFAFGTVHNPRPEDLKDFGIGGDHFIDIPSFLILVAKREKESVKIQFDAVHYNVAERGEMNYTNVMQFLYTANHKFRHYLPGDNQSNKKEVARMLDVIEIEQERFDLTVDGGVKTMPAKTKPEKTNINQKAKITRMRASEYDGSFTTYKSDEL